MKIQYKINTTRLAGSIIFLIIVSAVSSYAQKISDNFDDGYSLLWRSYGGEWQIKDKKLTIENGSGFSLIKNDFFINFSHEVNIQMQKKGEGGIIFSVLDPSPGIDDVHAYYAAINSAKDSVYLYLINKNADTEEGEKRRSVVMSVPFKTDSENSTLRVVRNGRLIDVFVNDLHMISTTDNNIFSRAIGLMGTEGTLFDNVSVTKLSNPTHNWSWVRGVVYLPTNCVNPVQHWEEFDPDINNRELLYAGTYGFNVVKVSLHYLVWEKDRDKFIKDVETFLTLANKHHLKTVITFFDDLWDPEPHLGPQPEPVTGSHNKRWVQCPGEKIKANYSVHRDKLKSYVQDVVLAHKNDPRIAFWEAYNEPGFLMKGEQLKATRILLNDTRIWIKETGSQIPVTATADPDFIGLNFSDFYSWHSYDRAYGGPRGPEVINTECLNRSDQTVAGIMHNFAYNATGFIIWELGIGKDNARFHWLSPKGAPEPSMPFQGFVFADGHPWDTNEVGLIRGNLDDMPVFNVKYFTGNFEKEKKWSFTPCINFELGDERGTGSPDPSIGIEKDNFSIRWTGHILTSRDGMYTFYVNTDNIARVRVNGKQIINHRSKNKELQASIQLMGEQQYPIEIEYIHQTGNSKMHVSWSGPDFLKTLLPGRRSCEQKKITKENMFSTK